MKLYKRRTFLKTVGGTGALLAVGTGSAVARGPPSDSPGRQRQGASAEDTIYDIAAGNDAFSILVAALEETGLDGVLDGNGQYTVFAPTNAAFAALLDDLEISADELLARDDLKEILLYHVTNGRRYSPSVVNAPKIRMLNEQTVTVDGTVLNGDVNLITDLVDIEASNGVIHAIDGVLLP
ncbi:MAG: fasciclin domain-containing protein [Halobacteriota archaeon]